MKKGQIIGDEDSTVVYLLNEITCGQNLFEHQSCDVTQYLIYCHTNPLRLRP